MFPFKISARANLILGIVFIAIGLLDILLGLIPPTAWTSVLYGVVILIFGGVRIALSISNLRRAKAK